MAVVQPYHPNQGRMNSTSPDGTTTVSRLAQMQARFQQKQQQEKEQKLLALYADQARQAYAKINGGGGKVRQLFQERRGLDRSYPLQPLEGRRGTSLDRGQQRHNARRANSQIRAAPPRYPSAGYEGDDDFYFNHQPPVYSSQQRLDQDYYLDNNNINNNTNNNNNNYSQQNRFIKQQIFADENDYFSKSYDLDSTKIFKKLPNIGGSTLAEQKAMMAPAKEQEVRKPPASTLRTKNSDSAIKSVTKSMAKLTLPSRKPEGKSVLSSEAKTRVGVRRPTPVPVSNSAISRPSSAMAEKRDQSRTHPIKATVSNKGPAKPCPSRLEMDPQLVTCNICNRSFATDRIEAHQLICLKTSKKKRKPFDPTKQRLQGTGAEKFLRKGKPSTPPTDLKKSNWRKKHEEFITNIRAAKQAQAHVAAGGKISDLPPPPPLDTSDYIQCPHCGRKFNQSAAERHVPKCATMLHNKPKPGMAKPQPFKRK